MHTNQSFYKSARNNIIFCVLSIFSSALIQAQGTLLNKKQAVNYINQVIDSLFSSREIAYNQDLEQFKRKTRDSLVNTLGFYPSFHALSQVYNTRDLKEGALGQVTLYIEQKTREYAHAQIRHVELPQHVGDRALVNTVVAHVRDQLAQKLTNTQEQAGLLSNYIGTRLKERVNKLIHDEIRKPAPAITQKPVQQKKTAKTPVRRVEPVITQDESSEYQDSDYIYEDYYAMPKRRRYVPAAIQTELMQPVPVLPAYQRYTPYGYAVEVVDVYEPAYGYAYEPCYAPVYGSVPGLSIGAGLPLGDGFLGFQFNI